MLIRKIEESHEKFSKCVTVGGIEGYSIQYRCLTHSCPFEPHANGRKQCDETEVSLSTRPLYIHHS